MEIWDTSEITLKDLVEKAPSKPVIISHNSTPVIISLPAGTYQQHVWSTEGFESIALLLRNQGNALSEGSQVELSHQREVHAREPDPGMLEVSMAISGVAIAVAVFLPEAGIESNIIKLAVAVVSTCVAIFSSYGALWLLAEYLVIDEEKSLLGHKEIQTLLRNFGNIGPYQLMVVTIFFILILPFVIGFTALQNSLVN